MNEITQETIKIVDHERKYPYIFIDVCFKDDDLRYKDFQIIATHYILSKINNSCRETLKQDRYYKNTIYNETINLAFRPKVNIDVFCRSVIQYICCNLNRCAIFDESHDEPSEIRADIHLCAEELSNVYAWNPFEFRSRWGYDFAKKPKLAMFIQSKIEFLLWDERKLLLSLINIATSSKQFTCRLTIREIAQILFEDDQIDDYDFRQTIRCLKNLSYYEFILFNPDYIFNENRGLDEWHYDITIWDLKIINTYLDAFTTELSRPTGPGISMTDPSGI